ncbi:hypothetical protein PsYK624_112550 [Phanerochaete sordida]|uniref:DUF6535 domain-containing protein n=1 Tax=Phanerochaete sordida TaxID=48140 RepID=A0A9P3GHL5_9APHY|nr:hypothetical protein PsYK624_112550 [Phanerochaete sordida]
MSDGEHCSTPQTVPGALDADNNRLLVTDCGAQTEAGENTSSDSQAAKGNQSEIVMDDPKDAQRDVTAGWMYLLSAGQDYDQEKIEKWKPELDNLLVFAGLFSGVVTAFSLEAYSWLSPNPTDTTNQLLLQISAQLASFSMNPGFANSTAPIAVIPSSFTPDHTDVLINMLWFLSLTFSLIAVFFTIAAQQWIRALPIPRHIPLEDSVRLWLNRRTNFIGFQVPNIIIMLPVLLQIAVILFLVGLYCLLQTLNHPITTAFAIVAGIPFFLYGLSLFGPLVFPSNPFKSPIVPVAMFVLDWIIMVLGTICLLLVLAPFFVVAGLLTLWTTKATGNREYFYASSLYTRRAFDWYSALLQKLARLSVSVFTRDQDFWTAREVRALASEKSDEVAEEFCDALALAPCAVPRQELVRLRACLHSLPPRQRMNVVLCWATVYSGKYDEMDFNQVNEWAPVNVGMLRSVDAQFTHAFAPSLLDALPGDWAECDWVKDCADVTSVLVLLARIVSTGLGDAELRRTVMRTLCEVVRCQRLGDIMRAKSYDNFRFPVICLFDCVTNYPDVLPPEDLTTFMSVTLERLPVLHALNEKFSQQFIIPQTEYVLAAAGVALSALVRLDDSAWAALAPEAHTFLRAFDEYVCAEKKGIQFVGALAAQRPAEILIVTPRAATAISTSVLRLADAGRLPEDLRAALMDHLMAVWANQRGFREAAESLSSLTESMPKLDAGSGAPVGKAARNEAVLMTVLPTQSY